ncbi:hypothetical protein AB0862_020765 [Acinetobacter baumannii]
METLSGNLIQSINSRQLDIAIIFTNEIDKQWSIQPLVREQMYLMARKEVLEKYGLSECIKSGIIQSQQIGDIPLVLPRQRHSLRKLLEHKIGQLNVVYEIDGLHLLMDSLIHAIYHPRLTAYFGSNPPSQHCHITCRPHHYSEFMKP